MPLTIVGNDITRMQVDCIVNSTNELLQCAGRGVDYSIHRAAGPELQKACSALAPCPPGQAVITEGYRLPAKHVIHAVGPIWKDGNSKERELLSECYRNVLALAVKNRIESLALPVLSSGAYRFPKDVALQVAKDEIGAFLELHDMDIYLVVYNKSAIAVSRRLFTDVRQYVDEHFQPVDDPVLPARSVRYGRPRRDSDFEEFAGDLQRSLLEEDDHPLRNTAPARPFFRSRPTQSSRMTESDAFADHFSPELPPEADGPEACAAPPVADAAEHLSVNAYKQSAHFDRAAVQKSVKKVRASFTPDTGFEGLDKSFAEMVLYWIDEKGITDVACYKAANLSRAVFNKLKQSGLTGGTDYRPSKNTALALAIGLKLDLEQTQDLLLRAGYALSPSFKTDLIVEYFIRNRLYNMFDINETLYEFDQPCLGSI